MSDIPSFAVTALVCFGIGILCTSLLPVRDILRIVRAGSIRWGWIGLSGLIFLFIMGYATFGWLRFGAKQTSADVIVALILFFGACFVICVASLSRKTAEDVLRIAALERDAFVDPLTGLFNRRYLSSRLDEEISRPHRYKLKLSALLIDIDNFKLINDDHGHQAGDEVLRRIGALIAGESRPSDIVARYGGEEILLIARNTDDRSALAVAERLRRAIETMTITTAVGAAIPVTASIGLASLFCTDDASKLIERADRALYEAKHGGRNRICGHEHLPRGRTDNS